MPVQARKYGDITVAIRKPGDSGLVQIYGDNPQIELVQLVADVPAGSEAISAIEKLGPTFETLIDLMTFEMGTPLGAGQMNATDITPPVSVGDDRAWSTFTAPPFDRHARAVEMQAIQGLLQGRLPESLEIGDSKTAAILRWFVKALSTDLLHDQFISLWIALEILCDASEAEFSSPMLAGAAMRSPRVRIAVSRRHDW